MRSKKDRREYKMPAQRAETSLPLVKSVKLAKLMANDINHHLLQPPLLIQQLEEADVPLPQVVVAGKRSPAFTYPQGTFGVVQLSTPSLALALCLKHQPPAPLLKATATGPPGMTSRLWWHMLADGKLAGWLWFRWVVVFGLPEKSCRFIRLRRRVTCGCHHSFLKGVGVTHPPFSSTCQGKP